MEQATQAPERSKALTAIYTGIGLLLGAAIGGPFLWLMIWLLNA